MTLPTITPQLWESGLSAGRQIFSNLSLITVKRAGENIKKKLGCNIFFDILVFFYIKENSIKRFLKNKDAVKHFPAEGEGTLSGIIVETNTKTGLAKNVIRIIDGGSLTK